ncbi:MAG TPA: ABC transporter ATP-binding protein [Beijerinckiaceae bacterium]|nr:ABC transporter ATP-binding protein [Beijerinckiaceae bacterium]
MTEPALSTRNLNKKFGSLTVARDICLSLPRGARHALIGPNGAGKTSLVNLVTGVLTPDSGDVLLEGEIVTTSSAAQRARRGLARTFQINSLFAKLTPIEAVTLAVCERRGLSGKWWRSLPDFGEAVEEAGEILTSLHLRACATRLTCELPYGEQRLLEIALALATKPAVLLLDEPGAGVPKDETAQVFTAIEALSEDLSILFIEHDMNVVFRFASKIVVMAAGAIVVEGSPPEIARDALVREIYLGKARHG